jgi:hypothetical protein
VEKIVGVLSYGRRYTMFVETKKIGNYAKTNKGHLSKK